MGEPVHGASSGPTGAVDPPTGVLDSPSDLAGTPPVKEPNANVTRKMYQKHLEEEEEEEEEEEDYEKEHDEEEDDREGAAEVRASVRESDDMFKYRGCSWPEVVGLKAEKAKRIIRKGKPDIYFEVVSERQLLTMCYCSRRVRLIVGRSNCVVRTPRVG
ncbi:hypothetical protein QYE76_015240 [Lolium multiflorum]|uniref:Uncharacterized protein n=1 Tax=Lolium multiflorum TaxID=4521 RepID=A0AAD8U632_LOLMU|nr:hypothetical protein QYE76_015240 [Lolium multiflorum]